MPIKQEIAAAFSNQEEVIVSSKAYTGKDSVKVLRSDLLYVGIQPIELTIQNRTGDSLELSESSIEAEILQPKTIVDKIHRASLARSIGLKVIGFFFWPFTIPSTIDSIVTHQAKANTKKNILSKAIKAKGEVIPAYSTIHRLFFVKSDKFRRNFQLTLQNKEAGKVMHFNLLPHGAEAALASKLSLESDDSPLGRLNRIRAT